MEYDGKDEYHVKRYNAKENQRTRRSREEQYQTEAMRHTETDSHGLEEPRPSYRAIWTVNVEILESQSPCRTWPL